MIKIRPCKCGSHVTLMDMSTNKFRDKGYRIKCAQCENTTKFCNSEQAALGVWNAENMPKITIADPINPSHYQSSYEWKDFAREYRLYGNFWNFKYLVRAGKKEGVPEVQDWEKFRKFMRFELDYIIGRYKVMLPLDYAPINQKTASADLPLFIEANKLCIVRAEILKMIFGIITCDAETKFSRVKTTLEHIIYLCDIKIKELEAEANGKT